MFAEGLVIKKKVDAILNTKQNAEVFDEVMALENSVRAASLLDEMMVNAGTASRNVEFELELQKLKNFEKVANTNLQKMRTRRAKLKRMYNTYKKPMLERNLQNIEKAAEKAPKAPTSLQNSFRARRTRKSRR